MIKKMLKAIKRNLSIRSQIKAVIYILKARRIGENVDWDDKIEFEKDILKLLEKYEIYKKNKNNILTKVSIECNSEDYPKVKLTTLYLPTQNK